MRWIVRILAGAVALAVAAALIGGISVGPGTTSERVLTLLAVAVIFGLVNAIVRPIVRLISIPLFISTLAVHLCRERLMLLLTAWIGDQSTSPSRSTGSVGAARRPGDQRGHLRDQRDPARPVRGPLTGPVGGVGG